MIISRRILGRHGARTGGDRTVDESRAPRAALSLIQWVSLLAPATDRPPSRARVACSAGSRRRSQPETACGVPFFVLADNEQRSNPSAWHRVPVLCAVTSAPVLVVCTQRTPARAGANPAERRHRRRHRRRILLCFSPLLGLLWTRGETHGCHLCQHLPCW